MSPHRPVRRLAAVAVLLIGGSLCTAGTAQAAEAELPSSPAAWLNSPPLTNAMLAGKAALLYYFEEDCPRCRERWPELLATAKKFDGKPIVFIGVNSGTPRVEVQQYAREVGLTWPVVVDQDRAFETASGVNEISLSNIYQVKLLLPDGSLAAGDWSDLEGSANQAVAKAAWKVDPAEIPDALRTTWQQIEFGNFGAAAAAIKSGLNSPKPEVKTAMLKLQSVVLAEIDKDVTAANAQRNAEQKWPAYKAFTAITATYRGYDLPGDVAAALKELSTDETVKNESLAAKQWEAIQRQAATGSATAQRTAVSQAQRLVQQFPGTEAAAAAQAALDRVNAAAQGTP